MNICEVLTQRCTVCREVLDDLPEWFGIPHAKAAYVSASETMPMLGAFDDREPVGFVSIKRHTPYAAELHVLGVKKRQHRRGIGRALVEATVRAASRSQIGFLTVKTLAPSHPDRNYAATRLFYEAMGFVPIEVIPNLWGSANPCLLMMKPVERCA